MGELGLTSSFIVTRNEEERFVIEDKIINLIPAWRFLINLSFG